MIAVNAPSLKASLQWALPAAVILTGRVSGTSERPPRPFWPAPSPRSPPTAVTDWASTAVVWPFLEFRINATTQNLGMHV